MKEIRYSLELAVLARRMVLIAPYGTSVVLCLYAQKAPCNSAVNHNKATTSTREHKRTNLVRHRAAKDIPINSLHASVRIRAKQKFLILLA